MGYEYKESEQAGKQMAKEVKTNAMRILEQNKISYHVMTYICDEFIEGTKVADLVGMPYAEVFKTLVAVGKSGQFYVFVLPVDQELDLKKAAKAVEEKSVAMLPLKDLTKVTGYIRGGCTAIGMKKQFPTVIEESAKDLEYMYVSGGKIGMQLKLKPEDLKKASRAEFGNVIFD